MPEPSNEGTRRKIHSSEGRLEGRAGVNGSGAGAARYVNNVGQFASYSGEVA